MFTNTEIAELMVSEIGETVSGQQRKRAHKTVEHTSDRSVDLNQSDFMPVYRRKSSTAGLTTYKDINTAETITHARYHSAGKQVENAYTFTK